ncbi:hypothetical protein GOODEAATRI_018467, partial [Goodea atripinnis]
MFVPSSPYLCSVSAGRVSLVRTTALRLEPLQLDDQGLYDCRILLLDNPADEVQSSNWTLLSVT